MYRHVHFSPQLLENTEQGLGFFLVAAGEVPFTEFKIRLGTKETPRHHAERVDKVFYEVVRLGDGLRVKCRQRQVVKAFKAAPLKQLGQAALQRHFKAWVGTKGGKHTAGARVH